MNFRYDFFRSVGKGCKYKKRDDLVKVVVYLNDSKK